MARLIYALNQTLDGVIDHNAASPDPALFRHFIEDVRGLAGSIYGRIMYETMRYWDDDRPEWTEAEWEYAEAWRAQPKWVVSSTLEKVGPNATLIEDDVANAVRRLKEQLDGPVEVAGPQLANSLGDVIDEFRIYLHPVVAGEGKTYFTGPRPPLKLIGHERIGEKVIRLSFVPE